MFVTSSFEGSKASKSIEVADKRKAIDEIRRAVKDYESERQAAARVLEYSGEFDITNKNSRIFIGNVPDIGIWLKGVCLGSGSGGCTFIGRSITKTFDHHSEGFLDDVDEYVSNEVFVAKRISLESCSKWSHVPSHLKQEVEALSLVLNHPRIVSLIGAEVFGDSENTSPNNHNLPSRPLTSSSTSHLYVYMKYIECGISLSQRINHAGPLTESEAVACMQDILQAVSYIDSKGVIHRDIKASNIIVDITGNCFLADFGSATVHADRHNLRSLGEAVIPDNRNHYEFFPPKDTWATGIKGTSNWMAPEVMRGDAYSSNVDVWSLGCTLIEATTGKIPWKEFDNQIAAMFFIMSTEKSPIDFVESAVYKSWSSLMRNFLKACLQRDRLKRPDAATLLQHPWIYLPSP